MTRRVLGLLLTAVLAAPAHAVTLDDLRWERRVVVAHAEAESAAADALRQAVDDLACELRTRDTEVYLVTAAGVEALTAGAPPLAPAALAGLRTEGVTFQMALVGKDGGVKARAREVAALPAFLDRIDGMPMRRRERAERGDPCGPASP